MVKKSARRTRRTHPPGVQDPGGAGRVREDKNLAEPAKQFELHPNQIIDWKRRLLEHATDDFDGGAESRPRPFGSIFRVRWRAGRPGTSPHRWPARIDPLRRDFEVQ